MARQGLWIKEIAQRWGMSVGQTRKVIRNYGVRRFVFLGIVTRAYRIEDIRAAEISKVGAFRLALNPYKPAAELADEIGRALKGSNLLFVRITERGARVFCSVGVGLLREVKPGQFLRWLRSWGIVPAMGARVVGLSSWKVRCILAAEQLHRHLPSVPCRARIMHESSRAEIERRKADCWEDYENELEGQNLRGL